MKKISALLVLIFSITVMACSNVPPKITTPAMEPIDVSKPFYVVAERQKSEIEKALEKAGIKVSDSAFDAEYHLRVQVGTSRRTLDCGSVNNVIYAVMHRGIEVLGMKGRGPTGSCEPNIFDQMTQAIVARSQK